MTDWAKPTVGSLYVNYTAELAARDVSLALMFDSGLVNDSNIVTGTKRWNASNNNWEKYAAGTWSVLAAIYGISISGAAGSVPYSGISGKPTTLSGYGITDAYTQTSVNTLLAAKANLASPILTGSPKAPTPSTSSDDTSIATTEFVKNQEYLTIDSAAVGPVTINNSVSHRYFYSSYLYSDGTIKEWGHGAQNQMSMGGAITAGSNSPIDAGFFQNVSGETFVKLYVALYHRLALTDSGKVYVCGNPGTSGCLGLGNSNITGVFFLLPYFVTNNITITDISAGSSNAGAASNVTLFLGSNGNVYMAGRASNSGGAITDIVTPVLVTGLPSNIVGIYCGGDSASNSLFAWTSSTLYSWSRSVTGASGQNIGTVATNRPAQSVLSGSVVKIISEGQGGTTATTWVLLSNGEVWAAGYNGYGQIGDNTTTQSNVFKKVASLSGIVDITSCGGNYGVVMARNANGQIWIWGYNANFAVTGVTGNLLLPTLLSGTWKYMNGGVGCHGSLSGFFLINNNNELYFTGYNATNCSGISVGAAAAAGFRGIPTMCTLPKLLPGEYPIEAMTTHMYGASPYYSDSVMLTNKKRIFSVGYNGNGELGIGTVENKQVFTEVRL